MDIEMHTRATRRRQLTYQSLKVFKCLRAQKYKEPQIRGIDLRKIYMLSAFRPEHIPLDLLPPILEQLADRKDLHASALVSKAFYRAATPLLYRTIDSRVQVGAPKVVLFHPSTTLLSKPNLTQYVRHVTETGAVHSTLQRYYPNITKDSLEALRLCTNLESFTWADDSFSTETLFLSFLEVIQTLPIRNLTIRTYSDLGEEVWNQLTSKLSGLHKVAIWCMEGPPRVLQGWTDTLGSTLTHLELGRCAGVPPTILISVFSQLPFLRELSLKGAPSAAIPTILTYLPNLITLDTEYLGSGIYRQSNRPLPFLRNLTVRTSSMDTMGPQQLWLWIRRLTVNPSLESFVLNAFSAQGQTSIPRRFILDLAELQKNTLRQFLVGMAQLTLKDIECLSTMFPLLEDIVCCVASPDAAAIGRAVTNAKSLRTMRLHVQWIPDGSCGGRAEEELSRFTVEDATEWMLRENSRLRIISIGSDLFKGQWVLRQCDNNRKLVFEVLKDVAPDRWV